MVAIYVACWLDSVKLMLRTRVTLDKDLGAGWFRLGLSRVWSSRFEFRSGLGARGDLGILASLGELRRTDVRHLGPDWSHIGESQHVAHLVCVNLGQGQGIVMLDLAWCMAYTHDVKRIILASK